MEKEKGIWISKTEAERLREERDRRIVWTCKWPITPTEYWFDTWWVWGVMYAMVVLLLIGAILFGLGLASKMIGLWVSGIVVLILGLGAMSFFLWMLFDDNKK